MGKRDYRRSGYRLSEGVGRREAGKQKSAVQLRTYGFRIRSSNDLVILHSPARVYIGLDYDRGIQIQVNIRGRRHGRLRGQKTRTHVNAWRHVVRIGLGWNKEANQRDNEDH